MLLQRQLDALLGLDGSRFSRQRVKEYEGFPWVSVAEKLVSGDDSQCGIINNGERRG